MLLDRRGQQEIRVFKVQLVRQVPPALWVQPARRVLREFKARWGILGFRVRKALKVQLG